MITYNHEPFIREAIEGVLGQETNFPFRLIIGEDYSTDNTLGICKEYKSKYPDKIRLLPSVSNLGVMLEMTLVGSVGMFIGLWGMASAFSRLTGSLLGGALRDLISRVSHDPLTGYIVVFIIEAGFLLVSLVMLSRIDISAFQEGSQDQLDFSERTAIAGDV